ncbi:MAG TPA: cytochrome d ubiquinol oxidase subunit II [Actinobacteria bacterium]|nr:cytochrome d ubiquinol oxidase subunit II [Actinomycetota bacterium]
MDLVTVWFVVIAFFWIGYFILDGFDLGVGTLLPLIGRNEVDRRVLINAIGPVWDGNEVWLVVAGAATFAAFPLWYATMFSGFYLLFFAILIALIFRGLAFEYRGKHDYASWRRRWDAAIVVGSAVPAFLFGVIFGNVVGGSALESISGDASNTDSINYVGNVFGLLNPFSLVLGAMTLTVFATHGAMFLALKTSGSVHAVARRTATQIGLVAAVFAVVALLWAQTFSGRVAITLPLVLLAAVFWLAGLAMNVRDRNGWAFLLSAVTILFAVAALFLGLYPNVMPSSIDSAFNLTVTNASSQSYTLTVMTIVAVVMTPLVLLYQGWTYWVFRKRLTSAMIPVGTL